MTRWMILALLVRLGILVSGYAMNGSLEGSLAPDSIRYLDLAGELSRTGQFALQGVPELFRTPGYPLALVPGFWLGSPLAWILGLQILLSLATVALAGWLGSRITGNPLAGKVAALLLALEPLSATYAGFVLTETLFTFLIVAIVCLMTAGWESGRKGPLVVASLLLGFALLVRPSGILLPLILGGFMVWISPRMSRRLSIWVAFVVPLILVGGAWVARNTQRLDYPGLSTVAYDNLYWIRAARVEAAATGAPFLDVSHRYESDIKAEAAARGWSESRRCEEMVSRSMEVFLAHPSTVVACAIEDVVRTLGDPGSADFLKVAGGYREGGGLLSTLLDKGMAEALKSTLTRYPWLVAFTILLGAFLALLYAWAFLGRAWLTRRHPLMWLAVAIALSFILTPGGSSALARLRHPAMPFICIMAGAGFVTRKEAAMRSMKWIAGAAALALAACGLGGGGPEPRTATLWNKDVDALQASLERGLELRQQTLALGRELETRQGPLMGTQIERLRHDIEEHLKLKDAVMGQIRFSREFLEGGDQGESTDREALLALAGAALLYDNFVMSLSVFQEDARLRKVVRDEVDDPQWSRSLKEAMWEFHDPSSRRQLRRSLEHVSEFLDGKAPPGGPRGEWLLEFCRQSPSLAKIKKDHPLRDYARVLGLFSTVVASDAEHLGQSGFNVVSGGFGNVVGLVETRKGLMLGREGELVKVAGGLAPLDILLEKTPFRLTDKFIPGHFGHVAIWVGSEAELRAMGLWDHPAVRQHQARIKEGAGVLEALREGVQLNTLEHFMNVDDAAVLRHSALTEEEKKANLLRAFAQIDKGYDFNFDVETAHKIVCSELVYHVFIHEPWPTTRSLGRHTLSPDEVAKRVRPAGPFEVRAFFHAGRAVQDPEGLFLSLTQ